MTSSKCDYCKKCMSSNSSLKNHIAVHKKRLNNDIINYVIIIHDTNRRFSKEDTSIIQTWDTSNVINIKDLRSYFKLNIIYKNKPNDVDLDTINKKCIRNTFGISNNNGNFIGLMFKSYDYDEGIDGFMVDDVYVEI